MPRSLLTVEDILAQLAEAPRRMTGLTRGLTEAQLHRFPERGAWSANQVLAHLRACADARGEPIRQILAQDHPTFRAVNPISWLRQTSYLELSFRRSLRAFTKQRADILEILGALPREDWSRAATVTGAGKPLERTVRLYADWVARHERSHLKQIERIVKVIREE